MLTRMSKYIYIGILLLVIVLCFSVFSNAQQRWKIGLASQGFGVSYCMDLIKGATDVAKQFDIDLIAVDSQFSSDIQVNQVENLLAQKCDLIVIHPNNAKALGAKAQWVQSMGVPVIAVSCVIDPPSAAAVVNEDEGSGRKAAELLAKGLGYKGKIVIIQGLPGSSTKIFKDAGEDYILKKYPDIEVLDKKPANWIKGEAFTLMQNFLQAYPEIDGVLAHNGDMAAGAIEAIKVAGRKDIVVVGYDGSKEELDIIRSGDQYGTIAWDPYELGRQAIYTAVFILSQENKDLWKQMNGKILFYGTSVTKENVEEVKGF